MALVLALSVTSLAFVSSEFNMHDPWSCLYIEHSMDGKFLAARPQYAISATNTEKRVADVAHYNAWMDLLAPRLQQFRDQRYTCDCYALRHLLQLVHDLVVFLSGDHGDELPKVLWDHLRQLQYGIIEKVTEFWRRYYLGMEARTESVLWDFRIDDYTERMMAAWLWSASVDPKHLKTRLVTEEVGERDWEIFRTALWHCVSDEGPLNSPYQASASLNCGNIASR